MNLGSHTIRVLLLVCCLFPCFAGVARAAGVGTVIAVSGSVSALSADGKSRVLQKGALLSQGETAVTGKDGRVDLRFSDESLVQLRPETQFRVDEYSYVVTGSGKTDGNEKSFFSLLKGGFRAISGMIGKLRRNSYAVVTPTATIGIRGTDYSAALDNGLHVSVARGEISLDNNAGSFAVAEGQSAYVANADSAPSYRPLGEAARNGAARTGKAAASVQVKGNTRIDASTDKTTAVAVGQGNRATNQAGVIGGP